MDMNPYSYTNDTTLTPVDLHMFLNGTRVRVYYLSTIDIGYYRRSDMLDELRFYRPVPDPYTWYVYGEDQAAIVDINHLQQANEQQQQQQSSSSYYYYEYNNSDEEVAIRVLQESFQQASDEFVAVSGLTKEEISENLEITEYYREEEEEEESEVCVICQVEYEKNEEVGVIQCGHRFHPECIEQWLLFKNVCPLCKHQALN